MCQMLAEAQAEGGAREAALRAELQAAALRLARLVAERGPSDVIAEG